ncbi:cyanophycinase [Clostridium sp. USBA 49]|uniref:cyanophycinase n=1 Tax=Clostridium TaxID=1485 RepID=UPI000999A921|nr:MULTISPECIES: cyanophycinase [Clostridium]SKA81454.1 cyanophycinase [Clostridium sp. USBA 49]
MDEILKGNLIIIGGAEDKKGEKNILKEVCSKIDKEKDELVIATIATDLPKEVGCEYKNIFENLGVKNINVLNVEDRKDTHKINNIEMIKKASLVFFTGGDQLKITSILGGTPLYDIIHESYEKGCVYVGTSAGASVVSDTMIITGEDEESPKKCTLKMAPGLGLIKNVVIDQHFAQRGRIGRLLVAIAENPESLGIGIDEDTAIVICKEGKFKVIGSGAVYIIDGSSITYTNVSEQNPEEILSMFDIKMHVLKNGDKFNLNIRQPIKEDKQSKNENSGR